MPVTVRIPSPLRRLTGGKDLLEAEDGTLAMAIDSLEARFPGF